MKLTVHAPAKINWFLAVLRKRDDGYHDIVSLMQRIDLCDILDLEDAETLEVITDLPGVPSEQNLVFRAASALREHAACGKGARIIVKKNIPVAAGLGGGSSDAAATLMGLNRLWGTKVGNRELQDIALGLGSDVPFFLQGPCSLVEGKGEIVTPVTGMHAVPLVLVNPAVSVSTPWAYQSLAAEELTNKPIDIKLLCLALKEQDFEAVRSMLVNDLEKVVVENYPEIGRLKRLLLENGAEVSAMSGSGSTVFGVFRTDEDAYRASRVMGRYWSRVARTLPSDEVRA